MTKLLSSLAAVAALTIGSLAASPSFASELGAAYGGTTGALAVETRGLPTTPDEVRAQGGFATAGAVRWNKAPVLKAKLSAVSF